MNQTNAPNIAGYIDRLAQATPRDKTQTEVITDRLRGTLSTMAEYNSKMSDALDRLNGGVGASTGDTKSVTPPTPSDFVGCVTSLLDSIGHELARMESNGQRLARLA